MENNRDFKTVVITGGPSAGKTRCIDELKSFLSLNGYKVFVLHEIATELLRSGLIPTDGCVTKFEFQKMIFEEQLYKEKRFEELAKKLQTQFKIAIVLDRGLIDNKVYLSEDEFNEIINMYGMTEEQIFERYDIVIHLESLAMQEENSYRKTQNNDVRMEDKEIACMLNERNKIVWCKHKKMFIVGTMSVFSDKMEKVIQIITENLINGSG